MPEADDVKEIRLQECKRLYGYDSANGDVVDWLYTWLKNPEDKAAQAVLEVFLRRNHYDDASELLEARSQV